MAMSSVTDYLVVGAGAMGMAFTDALIDHADVHVTLVDRRYTASGHWQDAYPFVQLHQASLFYGVASTVLGQRRRTAERPRSGAPGTGPPVGDPGLLRRHPASPLHRLRPGHLPRGVRVPHGRRIPSRDVPGVGRDRGGRRATSRRRRHLPVTDDPRDDTTALRRCRRCAGRPDQRARPVDRGTRPLRDRRFRQDRHRRDRVVVGERGAARPHRLGPPARSLDAQSRRGPARSGGGARACGRHDGGGRRRRVARRSLPTSRGRRRDASHRPRRRSHDGQDPHPRRMGARPAPQHRARRSPGTHRTRDSSRDRPRRGVGPTGAGLARGALRRLRTAVPTSWFPSGNRTRSDSRRSGPASRASTRRWPASWRQPATTIGSATGSVRPTPSPTTSPTGRGCRSVEPSPRAATARSRTSPPGPTAAP